MNLLMPDVYKQAKQISEKYTALFLKYVSCHNLFNTKLIYSPVMLQELTKDYFRKKMMGVLRIWNFHD